MLAGRKLLLADDSVTIQKVIDLTFADEGVRVVAFNNGQEAIEHLEEIAPDIVLADVFMPLKNGYEVCEYVKGNEKLKHIPVMLLVGSFEPFDEAEARKVGADDILTKPFQSIRRLIDRVGALVGSRPPEAQAPTAELPKAEPAPVEEERLSTKELEIITADTRPLPEGFDIGATTQPGNPTEAVVNEEQMETAAPELPLEVEVEGSDSLLDLGEFEPRSAAVSDDFVLDLDFEEEVPVVPAPIVEREQPVAREFVEPQVIETAAAAMPNYSYQTTVEDEVVSSFAPVEEVPYEDQVHEIPTAAAIDSFAEAPASEMSPAAAPVTGVPAELSPEMIEIIARRAVEMLSDRVIREIAWEVVPELAELLIKRQLEEKESQPN